MADNSTQGGTDTIRDKDRAGVKTQIFGLDLNPNGASEVLQAAAALADATANPTVPAWAAMGMLFNGTTWDRIRGDTTNGVDVDVTRLPGSPAQEHTTAASPNGARLSDGAAFYNTNTGAQLPASLGQKTMANSLGVAIASDQSAVPVSLASVPTVTEKQDQPASATVTWTSATGVNTAITNSAVAGYGTATISIQTPSTATAGVITFEASDDAGTTWYPITGVRVDNLQQENAATLAGPGVAQLRMYAFSVDAMTNIRARLSTVITGTGNTLVRIGLIAGGIEPAVSIVPPRTPVTLYMDATGGITTEALATLTIQRGDAASTTGTTFVPTAGKTFRLLSVHFRGHANAAVMFAVKMRVRSLSAGTTTVTSPIRVHTALASPTASAVVGTAFTSFFMDAGVGGILDVPPGGSLGVSHVAGTGTYVVDACLVGYEF